jgi:tetratricopeptide (TPR) repeat protein
MVSRCASAYVSGDLPAAGALADQARTLALREGSSTNLGIVHAIQIVTRYFCGDLAGAEEHFTTGLRFFSDRSSRLPGNAATALGVASWNAWTLGRANVARERMAQMMALTNKDNPYDVAFSGAFAAQLRVYLREFQQAEALATRVLELSEKHQFPLITSLSRCILGLARAQLGSASEGTAMIRQGITGSLESGARLNIGNFTTYLAAAHACEGAIVDALDSVEQALQTNPDELFYQPETLRLRGELRLKLEQPELAEADFRESITLAQKMGAKAWELRATMSLARLFRDTGRRDEARAMLAEIYNWFTEGFDTADLKDAKALLDELVTQPD